MVKLTIRGGDLELVEFAFGPFSPGGRIMVTGKIG